MSCNRCGCKIGGKIGYCMSCWHEVYMTCPKCNGKGKCKLEAKGRGKFAPRWAKCTTC